MPIFYKIRKILRTENEKSEKKNNNTQKCLLKYEKYVTMWTRNFQKGKITIVKNAQKGRENEKVDRHHWKTYDADTAQSVSRDTSFTLSGAVLVEQ